MAPETYGGYNPEYDLENKKKQEAEKELLDVENREIIEKEFPKDPDERLNAILASVNTEYKSATLGFFLDDKWRTIDDIQKRSLSYLSQSAKPLLASTYGDYCTKSFIPIGAVAEDKIKLKGRTNPVLHFRLTEDGEKYAKPIAQFALRTAVENGMSMYEILGKTSSVGETRSPYNRARMLLELKKKSNLNDAELVKKIGIASPNVSHNLLVLKESGLLNYEAVPQDESGFAKYEWVEGKDPKDVVRVRDLPNLTREVAQKIQEIKIADYNEIAAALNKKQSQSSNIGQVLKDIERQGFVLRHGKFGKIKSDASLTEKGIIITDCISTIFGSLKKEDFGEINEKIKIFEDHAVANRYITRAFQLYENVSPAYKRKPKDERKSEILSLLKSQKLRNKQVYEKLGKDAGGLLNELLQSGQIKKEKEGRAVYYSLKK